MAGASTPIPENMRNKDGTTHVLSVEHFSVFERTSFTADASDLPDDFRFIGRSFYLWNPKTGGSVKFTLAENVYSKDEDRDLLYTVYKGAEAIHQLLTVNIYND